MNGSARDVERLPPGLVLSGRGRLARSAYADLVVFDPETIADRATFDQTMTPAACIRH